MLAGLQDVRQALAKGRAVILTGRQPEPDRQAVLIGKRMYFGG